MKIRTISVATILAAPCSGAAAPADEALFNGKDLPRNGHIGFQDHGHNVWYRKITIKRP